VPPAGANSQCLIRVSDSTTPSVSDTSNATFVTSTLPVADAAKYFGGANDGYSMVNNIQPNITITSPNGGESWAAYSTRTITWSYTNVDNVSIELSIDNGTSWTTLVASIPASQLSYSWTVPGTPSNYCSFRIKDIASSVSDINDAVFVIPNDLWVQIKYPNGGENFGAGTGQYIEWDYNNIQTLKLEYSLDNGANWLVIGTVNAANKYANWVVPSDLSNQLLLRASDVNNAIFSDVSDLAFSTYALPTTASEKYFGGSNDGYSMFSVIVVPSINYPPTISSFSPTSICRLQTQFITIIGTDLDTVTSVLFSGANGINVLGTITAQLATLLEVTVPLSVVNGVIRLLSPLGTVDSVSNLTINTITSPIFQPIAPICSGSSINPLPTTSNNGITGTWSPEINNTQTTTYIFTPNAGQCAGNTMQTIMINAPKVTSPISFSAPPVTAATLPSVTIGTQVWTNKNLDVSTYRDGTPIPEVTDPTAWANLTTGAWCYYNNDPINGAIYGKLYNWYAVNDPRGLAPLGWHVPSDAEWTTLTDYLGGASVAGGKMKETGNSHWNGPNLDATNSSGFNGLPGGSRYSYSIFGVIGNDGYWWSSTDLGEKTWSRYLANFFGTAGKYDYFKAGGFSVRLIKD
jgi:uncharacterized protein (TIGR02145 family)